MYIGGLWKAVEWVVLHVEGTCSAELPVRDIVAMNNVKMVYRGKHKRGVTENHGLRTVIYAVLSHWNHCKCFSC